MEPKPHKTYIEQLALLKERGMHVEDDDAALALLQRAGYYTLSGYSHSFRLKSLDGSRTDRFRPGTSFAQVQSLWEFDNGLRAVTFATQQHVETNLRALLGYTLGAVDPLVHLKPELLSIDRPADYAWWSKKLRQQIKDSREGFIVHHRDIRDGVTPIWVAVDVLDWGGLSYLYSFAPLKVREQVAGKFGLSSSQLNSWLRALNVVRNVCAHHSRFFNRYYSITPKLPRGGVNQSLDLIAKATDSTFGMLTLVQYLSSYIAGTNLRLIPLCVRSFPEHSGMNLGAVGAPVGWEALLLWSK